LLVVFCAPIAESFGVVETQFTALPIAIDAFRPPTIELAARDLVRYARSQPLRQRRPETAQ
jgi:hypothetical protein